MIAINHTNKIYTGRGLWICCCRTYLERLELLNQLLLLFPRESMANDEVWHYPVLIDVLINNYISLIIPKVSLSWFVWFKVSRIFNKFLAIFFYMPRFFAILTKQLRFLTFNIPWWCSSPVFYKIHSCSPFLSRSHKSIWV